MAASLHAQVKFPYHHAVIQYLTLLGRSSLLMVLKSHERLLWPRKIPFRPQTWRHDQRTTSNSRLFLRHGGLFELFDARHHSSGSKSGIFLDKSWKMIIRWRLVRRGWRQHWILETPAILKVGVAAILAEENLQRKPFVVIRILMTARMEFVDLHRILEESASRQG